MSAPGVVTVGQNAYLGPVAGGFQGVGAAREFAPEALGNSIAQLFGAKAQLHGTAVVNDLDARQSSAHGTTGIPYAISGTATVVQVGVAQRLADYVDPIKAILGVGMHRDQKIIIKRQYVAGGGAGIVPERAPARTVALQEDVREVMLTRYGGDIEFNMNLLLRPDDAAREMSLKVGAQERALEEALTAIGYDMLVTEGTNLVSALIRSNHLLHSGNARKTLEHAERIYITSIFGAMNKFAYPVHNLIAAAKKASAYDVSRATKTVLILPHGLPELLKYTRPEKMVYNVSGTKGPEPISMTLDGGHLDPSTGCMIYTHIPPSNNLRGAANPTADRSALSGDVTIAIYTEASNASNDLFFDWSDYTLKRIGEVFQNGNLRDMNGRTKANIREFIVDANDDEGKKNEPNKDPNAIVTFLTLSMSSAILSVPGGDVGELLVGYPSTSLSTNASTESGRMQLRCYLGSVLYRPEDVLILPDVAFDGIRSVRHYKTYVAPNGYVEMPPGDDFYKPSFSTSEDDTDPDTNFMRAYPSALWNDKRELKRTNQGHLGSIESPEQYQRVFGTQVFDSGPPLTSVAMAMPSGVIGKAS